MKFQDAIEIVRDIVVVTPAQVYDAYAHGYEAGAQNALDDAVAALEQAHLDVELARKAQHEGYLHSRARMNYAGHMRSLPSPIDLTENFFEASLLNT